MVIVPVRPARPPVPESGTTEIFRSGVPLSIMPQCCSANVPVRPASVPFTLSIAT